MNEATQTQTEEFERISETQHVSILNSPKHTGKYFYVASDITLARPYVGIDKSGTELRSGAFETKHELFYWLRHGVEVPKPSTADDSWLNDTPTAVAAKIPVTSEEDEAFREAATAAAQPTNSLASAIADIDNSVDPNDPMAILQEAQAGADKAFADEPHVDANPTTEFPQDLVDAILLGEDAATEKSVEELETALVGLEQWFVAATKQANDADAAYKEKLNDFNLANAELVGAKKLTADVKAKVEEELKETLVSWGKISGVKKFDEYLSVIESEEFDIDEAQATEWARANYPAAINEVTNQKLIAEYVKTSKIDLPFVTRRVEIKPRISRKF